MKHRLLNVMIALDQLVFSVITLGGSAPDETMSAAAYRLEQANRWQGRIFRPVLDWLFWWDPQHCYTSWLSELTGKHQPRANRPNHGVSDMNVPYTNQELENFFEWQLEQINPLLHKKNRDCWPTNTVSALMNSPVAVRGAVATLERAERRLRLREQHGMSTSGVAPWDEPGWREAAHQRDEAQAQRDAELKKPSVFVTGGS